MLVFWKTRYLNRADRTFGDRCLYLDTRTLDAATKAAIELLADSKSRRTERKILQFRSLFKEGDWHAALKEIEEGDVPKFVGLVDYLEDENAQEISDRELGPLLTGNPDALLVRSDAKPHDIELMMAKPEPLPLDNVTLSAEEVRTLGYFVRDLKELDESALRKDGPGIITAVGTIPSPQLSDPILQTGVTDDLIRSFVTIFRRFYMKDEPANFNKAVDVFVKALGSHPYAKWVDGVRNEFKSALENPPDLLPFLQSSQITFTTKRLIDVFFYTQYHHQPDERRQRQYAECLAQVNGRKNFLTWLFLTELWGCSLQIISAGRVIASWFNKYCGVRNVTPDVLPSIRTEHEGIGTIEKKEAAEKRLLEGKIEQLAKELWKQNGSPEGGHQQFLAAARQKLSDILGGNTG